MLQKRFPRDHLSRELFRTLRTVAPYPAGVAAVPEQIRGTSFFPGGTGLWCESSRIVPALPIGGVMVLGHDFHNVAGYNKAKHNVKENLRSPTWRNLIKFLDDTSIDLRHCFFTNVFMGLRQGVAVTGPFPGRSSPEFVARCQEFFLRQVALQQPKIVLALGTHVPKFLAPLSRQLTCWKSPADFRGRDANNLALIANVKFHRAPQRCVVVSIVHPSFHDQNVRLRHWRGRVGDAAELALVFEAKRRTNI